MIAYKSLSDKAINWADHIRKELDFPCKSDLAELLMKIAIQFNITELRNQELSNKILFQDGQIQALNELLHKDCGK